MTQIDEKAFQIATQTYLDAGDEKDCLHEFLIAYLEALPHTNDFVTQNEMREKPKFTPPPWRYYSGSRSVWSQATEKAICVVSGPQKQCDIRDANARLIANAPEYHRQTDLTIGGLELLRTAIEADDPKRELLLRVNDLIRECKAVQALANTEPQG
jgi:hypothetical protein